MEFFFLFFLFFIFLCDWKNVNFQKKGKEKEKEIKLVGPMAWSLMWLNRSIATISATLQFLDICYVLRL